MDTKSLFQKFYYDVKNIELDDEQMKIVNDLLEKVGEENENY